MKKISVMLVALVGVLFAMSCSSDEVSDTQLMVSEKTLEFESGADKKIISVTTDNEKWSAIGSDGWIKVSKSGSDLVVNVLENSTTIAREGKILVVSGNANTTIEVKQVGAKGYAKVIPEDIVVEQFKGSIVVDVIANKKEWTATTEADWLELTPKPFKGELGIAYKENTDRKERVAKVKLTVEGTTQEFVVKQNGILFFLTPYDNVKLDNAKTIIEFEKARYSTLTGDNTYEKYHYLDFNTVSEFFIEIRYLLAIENDAYMEGIAWAKKDVFEKEFEGFKAFLIEKGYVFNGDDNTFVNEEKQLEVTTKLDGEKYMVTFKYVPTQKEEYRTFDKFPYGNIEWGATQKEIDVYEKERGGVFNKDMSAINDPNLNGYDYLYYNVKDNSYQKAIGRAYYVNHADQSKVGHREIAHYFYNGNLAFYNLDSEPVLTREFKALCKKEGWKFYTKLGDGRYIFMKSDSNLALTVRYAKYPEYDKPILDLHVLEYQKNGASKAAFLDAKRVIRKKSVIKD